MVDVASAGFSDDFADRSATGSASTGSSGFDSTTLSPVTFGSSGSVGGSGSGTDSTFSSFSGGESSFGVESTGLTSPTGFEKVDGSGFEGSSGISGITGISSIFSVTGVSCAGIGSSGVGSVAFVSGARGKTSGTGGGASASGFGLAGGDAHSTFWGFLFFFFAMIGSITVYTKWGTQGLVCRRSLSRTKD